MLGDSVDRLDGLQLDDLLTKGSSILCQSVIFPSILHDESINEIQINFRHSQTKNLVAMVALANINSDLDDKVFWCFSSADEREKLVSALSSSKQQLEETNTLLKELATIDELTGTYNRRELMIRMHVLREQTERRQSCLSVFMLDIDHFKQVNDEFGHGEGDRILKKFGAALINNARTGDVVARYGGEEFVVIMPDVSRNEARQASDRLHHAVNNVKTPTSTITVSIGVCSLEWGTTLSPLELLEAADKMLYESKEAGRNRTSYHSFPNTPFDQSARSAK
jgi:diguanylate cyclase (GGDEF)-like protein